MDTRGPEIYDQVQNSHVLLAKMNESGMADPWTEGGENIEFIIKTSQNSSFAARDYKDQLTFAEQDFLETVSLPSRYINGQCMWFDAQVDTNSSKAKVIDLVDSIVNDAKDGAKTAFAMEMWQSGSGEHLHGIGTVFDHDNTYLGIDRTVAANAFWRARHSDAGHTSFTQSHADGTAITYGPYHTAESLVVEGGTDGGIQKLYDDLCDNGGTDGPNLAITTEGLYRKLCSLKKAYDFGYNQKLGELGWPENLQYRNMAITWDWNVTGQFASGALLAFNTKYWKMKPYAGYSKTFKSTETFNLYSNGILAKARIMQWRGNLACLKPQKQGALTGKTV